MAKKPAASSNQNSNREYYTSVTTWSRADGSNFVGLVSAVPKLDLSKKFTISVVGNGKRTKVDNYLDVTRLQMAHGANEGYIWASIRNNIILLNYVGNTPTSLPPFPLEVIIVY